jgi:hypothetical protein
MLNTLAYYGNGWKKFYDTSKQKDKKVFSTIFLSPIFWSFAFKSGKRQGLLLVESVLNPLFTVYLNWKKPAKNIFEFFKELQSIQHEYGGTNGQKCQKNQAFYHSLSEF